MVTASQLKRNLRFAGIAAKTAALRTFNRKAGTRYLLETLHSMPGLTAKASQMLSMKLDPDGSLPATHPEPIPDDLVLAAIADECPALAAELEEFTGAPQTASLGQVHRARLRDGRIVAIKVRYPGVDEEIEAQLNLLLGAPEIGPASRYGFDREAFRDFFGRAFARETDYRGEAERQTAFRAGLPDDVPVTVAQVLPEYSTRTILTQTFEDSTPLATVRQWWPADARRECGVALTKVFLHSLFRTCHVHTDPHPGNLGYRILREATGGLHHGVVFYDFGSTLQPDPEKMEALRQLIQAYQQGARISPFDVLVFLGFHPTRLGYIADRLPALCAKLFDPFISQGAFSIRDWDLEGHFNRILGDDKWWFRTAGPPWFLMLMRAVQGLTRTLDHLEAALPFGFFFRQIAGSPVPGAGAITIPDSGHLLPKPPPMSTDCARWLRVRVTEGKRQVVWLEMPARAVDELETVIPEDVRQKIGPDYDLAAIRSRAQASGYQPAELFTARAGDRFYRVWLE